MQRLRQFLLRAVLLFSLVSLSIAFPFPWGSDSLSSRQIGAPPLHDWANYTRPAKPTEFDAETWTLGTREFVPNVWQVQPYVANGYHGSRLTAEGLGYWRIHNETGDVWPINGWPLDNPRQTIATITGFWDSQRNTTRTNFPELLEHGGESVISGIPTWTSFVIATEDGHAYTPGVDPSEVKSYHQTLSLKDGVVRTVVEWAPADSGVSFIIDCSVVAHMTRITLGMIKCHITPSESGRIIVTDILDGAGAQRTSSIRKGLDSDDTIWTSVHPTGLDNVTAFEFSTLDFDFTSKQGLVAEGSRKNAELRPWVSGNESTISQEFTVETTKDETLTFLKYVGIASSDAFPDDTLATARTTALEAKKRGWNTLLTEHRAGWDALWDDADIVIPGPENIEEMQIAVRSSLFNLLSNIRPGDEGHGIGDNSIAVGGLSSDSYAGLVFWDADTWMLPGLLALHPERAAAINNYRYRLLPRAKENAENYGLPGALYPWTSGRFGNCTGTGPCMDYEYHINSDIVLVQWQQFLHSGDQTWLSERGWPIINAVADMWTGLVKKANTSGEDGLRPGMYTLHNMTDPDEYANHVDNGAFTNVGIKVTMSIARQAAKILGHEVPDKWVDIEENMFIPYNYEAGLIPEFGSMNGTVEIKQADVVLINYPLEFRLNDTQANHDLDFYARAQSADGPAMTWAIFAIDSLELSPHGCASWSYFLYASVPYLRAPWYQFSEQIIDNIYENGNTNPAFTFLTGHGGFLQILTHGFTGFRPRLDAFYLDPSIPPQLEDGVEVKGMKYHNGNFNVFVHLDNTTITRRPENNTSAKPITVRIAERNPQAGDYKLMPGEKLVVPTYRADLNGTDVPGNKAQCKTVSSAQSYVPGQFPVSAVDGSNHTNWQPTTPEPASLLVDLGEITSIDKIALNWAKWPPLKWSVHASNSTSGDWQLVHQQDRVTLSDPWVEEDALKVVIRTGNQTVVDVEGDYSGRWVKLVIEGDRSGTGKGGTVAQFAIL